MDALRKHIVELIKQNNTSLKEASLALGRNHAYLHQFIHKGTPRILPEKERYLLAQFLHVEEEQLRKLTFEHMDLQEPATASFAKAAPLPFNSNDSSSKDNASLQQALPIARKALSEHAENTSLSAQDLAKRMCAMACNTNTYHIDIHLARWLLASDSHQ